MSKRKRSPEPSAPCDFPLIVQKFESFVSALDELLQVTPEENFSTKALASEVEDRAVIAKVLKRMRTKGQLSWMDQYLLDVHRKHRVRLSNPSSKSSSVSLATPLIQGNEQTALEDDAAAAERPTTSSSDNDDDASQAWPPPLPTIHNEDLRKQAFTHRSYASACAPAQSTKSFLTTLHNERLEFLGDSFLNHTVTKMLFARLPKAREGELSLFRAELIGNTNAAVFGRLYEFDKRLLLNDTAERDGVRNTPKVIADTFEAYLGALILDGAEGPKRADAWLKQLMRPRLEEYLRNKPNEPIDTLAKQKVWNHFLRKYPTNSNEPDGPHKATMTIKYEWVDGGGGNDGGFVIAAKLYDPARKIVGQELGRGFGLNKKEAEHRAAMNAAKKLPNL